jgi:hypothetical protein
MPPNEREKLRAWRHGSHGLEQATISRPELSDLHDRRFMCSPFIVTKKGREAVTE